jgi:IS1 family transposase
MLSMNRLDVEERTRIVGCLVEGMSIRATSRLTGASRNTVTKLLVELGAACAEYQDRAMRNLTCKRIECDEIWSFVYAKDRHLPEHMRNEPGVGSVWTWVGIDADTKLIPSWLVGARDTSDAKAFMSDLRSRLANRVQLTTDGHKPYLEAVESAFGAEVDYAILVKIYGNDPEPDKRYGPAKCIGTDARRVSGNPDPRLISTSYVERQNLSMRMGMRRFTRLTNAFSKKIENLSHAVSLYFMHYNYARPHKTLSKPYPKTPAMAAGLADHVWSIAEIVGLLDSN